MSLLSLHPLPQRLLFNETNARFFEDRTQNAPTLFLRGKPTDYMCIPNKSCTVGEMNRTYHLDRDDDDSDDEETTLYFIRKIFFTKEGIVFSFGTHDPTAWCVSSTS